MKITARQEKLIKRTFIDYHQTNDFLDNPIIIDRAEGLYYWDADGKRYFDGISGIFAASLGHRHPFLIEAMVKQMEKLTFAPPLHSISNITLDFIEKLGEVTPDNLNYIKPYSGGSESIESAIKFVRQYFKLTGHHGKYKFISRYQAYHGGTMATMAASGSGSRKSMFEPHMSGFLHVMTPNAIRDRYESWQQANVAAAQMIEDVIVNEGPETVAGVLLEPIGNTGGVITPTAEYYQIIRKICDKYNVILIFDEIITGFGRTGKMFAAQSYGVTPDIICGGKGLSSGMIPLGAMIARQDMAEHFMGSPESNVHFSHGHTFAGNPLSSAIGLAVLEWMQKEKIPQKAAENGIYLQQKLMELKKLGIIREVRGMGMLQGVEFVKDIETNQPFPELGKAFKKKAIENGLILRCDPNWFAVAPALIAEKTDIDELVDIIEKSINEALGIVRI